jgi:multicomponent Na+:H+ antiporter subunit E
MWILMAAFWVALCGHWEKPMHHAFGLVSVTLVSALSHRQLSRKSPVFTGLVRVLRLFRYLPWLFWQIFVANIDVLLRVLGVRPVDPRIVRFEPDLESDFATVAFANSITLTPGTVTIEIEDGHFIVHAVAPEAVDGLLSGEMERRLRWVEGRGS